MNCSMTEAVMMVLLALALQDKTKYQKPTSTTP
jgi:hypothetical protein